MYGLGENQSDLRLEFTDMNRSEWGRSQLQ